MGSNLHESIVLLKSAEDPANRSFGTGFVIHQDEQASYILTCQHVIRMVSTSDKLEIAQRSAVVIASGSEDGIDLAILRVEGLVGKQPLRLRAAENIKEHFHITGFQLHGKQHLIKELQGNLGEKRWLAVPGLAHYIEVWDLLITGEEPLDAGNSGSPVFDTNDRVIGVVATRHDGGRKGLAIPIGALAKIWPEGSIYLCYQEKTENIPGNQSEAPYIPGTSSRVNHDWGDAPDVSVFFGRAEELRTLEHWILNERCRLVGIVGMYGIGKTTMSVTLGKGGIGKTDLSIKLARGIQEHFEYVFWRSLKNPRMLSEFLGELIKYLSDQKDIHLPDTVDDQILRLISYLRQHRCLVILDNVESILQGGKHAGQYREGYEAYAQLFKQIAEISHQSTLIFTSREKPPEVDLLKGPPRPVRLLELRGLDYDASKQRLIAGIENEQTSFIGSEDEWKKLIDFYKGNPLALEIVAKHITDAYQGNITAFLQDDEQVFADLHNLLDWHFQRLPDLAKEIMYWFAINREPTSISELREDIVSPAKRQVPSTLQLLQRLLPLETVGSRFTLQPVLMEYMTEQLIQHISEEITSGRLDLLKSHSLLKALAKDYVREAQIRVILQPVLQDLVTKQGKSSSKNRLQHLLTLLHQISPLPTNYAAGNVLNLLIQLGTDLHGIDCSYLPVWQAYLREVDLIDVNFAYVDFARTVFSDTFGSILSVVFSPDGSMLAAGTSTGEIRVWQAVDGMPLLTYSGHTDWVWALAFSPDGRTLASGSSDQTLRLWEVATGQCIRIMKGHTHRIRSVAFRSDGELLASASEDWTIRLWSPHSGKLYLKLEGHINPVRSIAFGPDGKTLVSGSDDHTIRIWDITTGTCLNILYGHTSQIWSLALSHDGRIIASGSDDKTVRTWDTETGQCLKVLKGHTNWICSLAFSLDDQLLASGSADQTVRLWDASTGHPVNTLQGHTNWVNAVCISPDGLTLASGSHDQTVRMWEIRTGYALTTLRGYSTSIRSVVFHPYERLVANSDRLVRLWNIDTGQNIASLQGHSALIRSLTFSYDGKLLASGSDDWTVRLWRVSSARVLHQLRGHTNRVKSVTFNPDGTLLASGSDDQTVRLWNVETGQPIQVLRGHTNRIRSVAFSPDNTVLASGSDDQTARIWKMQTDEPPFVLQGHTNRVWSIAFSPDGRLLATGSEDTTIRLWDVKTAQCLLMLSGHTNPIWSIVFHPSGTVIASSSEDQTVRLWDVQTGQLLQTFRGHTSPIWTIAFSPDGSVLASGSHDHTVRLWDCSSGTNLAVLQGHKEPVWSVVFSSNGELLASGSEDGTCRLWDVQTQSCKRILKSERPYERMNIAEVTGLTDAQKTSLRVLGAIENEDEMI